MSSEWLDYTMQKYSMMRVIDNLVKVQKKNDKNVWICLNGRPFDELNN